MQKSVGRASARQELPLFTETTSYEPSSPYSANKASSDHLVRAWLRTYGFPKLITNSSNNYGPYHFPEKLTPLVILNALEVKPLPIYGKGDQIRGWLYVDDHARTLYKVVAEGKIGETYNIGGHNELQNIEKELGWKPQESFETSLRKTIQWYLDNQKWCKNVQDGSYQRESYLAKIL